MGKLIVFTAPSGAGKTTIVKHLLKTIPQLAFSVSATTRRPREGEREGIDYYFIAPESFQQLIKEHAFVEWEEVYPNQFYGTLRQEIHRLWNADKHIIFDIDVEGALSIKKHFPDQTLTVFVKPPSKKVLRDRLQNRDTEDTESLKKRIAKAELELSYENKFDRILVNDVLDKALEEAAKLVKAYINTD